MGQFEKKMIEIFLDESREHLENIEVNLLMIEQDGREADPGLIDKVFRAVHTIKGSSGFFGFTKIKELSHHMENVLGKIRSRTLVASTAIITPLLDGADTLKKMVNSIEDAESYDLSRLVRNLEAAAAADNGDSGTEGVAFPPDGQSGQQCTVTSREYGVGITIDPGAVYAAQQASNGRFVYIIEIDPRHDTIAEQRSEDAIIGEIGMVATIVAVKHTETETPPAGKKLVIVGVSTLVQSALTDFIELPERRVQLAFCGKIVKDATGRYLMSDNGADRHSPGMTVDHGVQKMDDKHSAEDSASTGNAHVNHERKGWNPGVLQGMKKNDVSSRAQGQEIAYDKTLRVAIGTLDRLMTLAGEMVLTRNELLQNLTTKNLHRIQTVSQKVDSITTELQETIMSTRMLSIDVVISKFRRLVRDVAMKMGKQILLDIKGEEVELDKSIVEAIGDPLLHLVRNSIDHGIETPEVRLRAGKKEYGTLCIKASHEAGHVLLEIADDGKGIDPAVIKNKAKQLGMIDEATSMAMSDSEAIKLIFTPGLSTAENITELSGRGVGMDVVQNNLKRVGGSIDIDSIPGKGTTIRIKLPLTLAIIPALLICVEDERFAIPQSNIEELVRIPAAEVKQRIEAIGDAVVLRLRGELLPLVRLADVLEIQRTYIVTATGIIRRDRRQLLHDRRRANDTAPPPQSDKRNMKDRRKSHHSAQNIVVVAAGDFKYGIIANSLMDSAEIVVKPLGYHFCDCREYAGATILGDGHVALILDIMGIRRLLETRITSGAVRKEKVAELSGTYLNSDIQSFLMIENGERDYFAIPVGLVSRIDRLNESTISRLNGKQAAHYRDATLRLFSIEDAIAVKKRRIKHTVYIIIIQVGGREIGILASEIIDTISIAGSEVDCVTYLQPGIMGSVYVKDALTLILDVFGMVRHCAPELAFTEPGEGGTVSPASILIVEDSAFCRYQICSFIEDAGYDIICKENGAQGLAFLKSGEKRIDLVLTDIEMPEMNGLELTRAIRADERLKDIPVIALTSLSGAAAEQRGREAGVNEYLIKFERQSVLQACRRFIGVTV